MAIPNRAQWVKERDKHGGSAGLVKGVSVGTLLDAYERAIAKSPSMKFEDQMFVSSKELQALQVGLKKYQAGAPKSKAQLVGYVDALVQEIDGMFRRAENMANPAKDIRAHTEKALAVAATVVKSGDRKAYDKMYQVNIRGSAAAWKTLVKLQPDLKNFFDKSWLPLSSPEYASSGVKTGGTAADATEADKQLKQAARLVQLQATKVLAELRKRNIIR